MLEFYKIVETEPLWLEENFTEKKKLLNLYDNYFEQLKSLSNNNEFKKRVLQKVNFF